MTKIKCLVHNNHSNHRTILEGVLVIHFVFVIDELVIIKWVGDLVDLRVIESGQDLYVRMATSDMGKSYIIFF